MLERDPLLRLQVIDRTARRKNQSCWKHVFSRTYRATLSKDQEDELDSAIARRAACCASPCFASAFSRARAVARAVARRRTCSTMRE